MEPLKNLADLLYTRFVLLDVFGKIVPGSVVLLSGAAAVLPLRSVTEEVRHLPWPLLALGLGASWIVSFAIQWLGEWQRLLPLLQDVPNSYDRGRWYEKLHAFRQKASEEERQTAARLLVIKEASGNAGMALAVAIAVHVFRVLSGRANLSVGFAIVGVIGVCALVGMHRETVDRHKLYVETVAG